MRGTAIEATLATELPATIETGLGNVLPLAGALNGAPPGAAIEVSVGRNRVGAVVQDAPPPGELTGSGWWQAIVPIAPVPGTEAAVVSLGVRTRDGERTAVELGRVQLEPGEGSPSAPGPVRERVAICMATHEPPPELLRTQIESIRSQTHDDWVCLISDDGSSDVAVTAIEQVIAGDSRFRLEAHPDRVGFYRNFERALRTVPPDARYVALSDQDDGWHPDKLATLLDALRPDDVLVHSDARIVDPRGRVLEATFWPRGRPRDDRLAELLLASAVSGAAALFRREALPFVLPLPALAGRAFHDRWIALVSRALGGIAYVDRPLYDYVQHEEATHGHDRAVGNPGRATPMRERMARLGTGYHPDWRAAHEDYLLRSVSEAIALRLRLGSRIAPDDRRAVARIEALAHSPLAQARLAVRWLARAPRRRPGLEGALVRGVLWQRLVPARTALEKSRRSRPRPRLASPGRGRRRPGARLRYGLTVTRDDPAAGFGDLFTARELGAALEEAGGKVVYLDLNGRGWRRTVGSVDVIVSLLDRFPVAEAPAGAVTVAWVRNWTERWLARDWFKEYDLAFATSEASLRLIRERSPVAAELMPLATNPRRFRPVGRDAELAADLAFVGSYWGGEREVQRILPALARDGLSVKVFGHGWEDVPGIRELCPGPLAYDELPAVYSSAGVVVDDSASHTRGYGAVNSRVFDALACGGLVVTNDADGAAALFGEGFPTWHDAATLRAKVELARNRPEAVRELIEPLRRAVLAGHTYAHRAIQLQRAVAAAHRGWPPGGA